MGDYAECLYFRRATCRIPAHPRCMNMHPDIARRRAAPPEFENALARHEPSLRNLARSLCRSHEKADRLVEVVLAKARAEHGSFDRAANLAAWLMKRMRNEFTATLTASTAVDLASGTKPKDPAKAAAMPPKAAPIADKTPAKKAKGAEVSGDFRLIDITPFLGKVKPKSGDLGTPPELAWIDIDLLRLDVKYQREILRSGRKNVIEIAANFDWSLFATVIVARIHDGLYAIVDGQHRTTSAACCGITKVPCQIIQATPEQQAAALPPSTAT
jgi:ParB-like nuclease domain/Sigma-70 region 2